MSKNSIQFNSPSLLLVSLLSEFWMDSVRELVHFELSNCLYESSVETKFGNAFVLNHTKPHSAFDIPNARTFLRTVRRQWTAIASCIGINSSSVPAYCLGVVAKKTNCRADFVSIINHWKRNTSHLAVRSERASARVCVYQCGRAHRPFISDKKNACLSSRWMQRPNSRNLVELCDRAQASHIPRMNSKSFLFIFFRCFWIEKCVPRIEQVDSATACAYGCASSCAAKRKIIDKNESESGKHAHTHTHAFESATKWDRNNGTTQTLICCNETLH